MFRKLVNVAVALLIANALYRFVPPYLNYIQFRDAVHEALLFSRGMPDSAVADRIAALAEEHHVPVGPDDIEIRHEAGSVYVDASYVQRSRSRRSTPTRGHSTSERTPFRSLRAGASRTAEKAS